MAARHSAVRSQRRGEIALSRQHSDEEIPMSSVVPQITKSKPVLNSFAIAALLGATMFAGPLTSARADTVANAAFQLAQASTTKSPAGTAATTGKGETVEQRISSLHTALKITPDEDAKWNAVAQSMRENASAMDKLVAENRTKAPQNMTAMEDLQMHQKFTEAHVAGLKNLIASFSTLYSAMPDAQKKIADTVFQSSRQTATARS
jgi:protein CpxP